MNTNLFTKNVVRFVIGFLIVYSIYVLLDFLSTIADYPIGHYSFKLSLRRVILSCLVSLYVVYRTRTVSLRIVSADCDRLTGLIAGSGYLKVNNSSDGNGLNFDEFRHPGFWHRLEFPSSDKIIVIYEKDSCIVQLERSNKLLGKIKAFDVNYKKS